MAVGYTGNGRPQAVSGDNLGARAQNAESGVATLVRAPELLIAPGSAIATVFAGACEGDHELPAVEPGTTGKILPAS